jgi:cobalt-zinc-cadmium efflux system outer membrane protein
LPGADAPPIQVPTDPDARRRFFQEFYPPIPPVPPEPAQAPGPEGKPLTLSDLQRLADTYSPALKSATAAVEAARGAAAQAGMYPNPTLGWEHDTIQTGPAGYPGFWVDQLIKTGGKLTVAQAAATMDLINAKLALRRARSDLRYAVRGSYFALLVARENIRVNEALYQFAEEVYRVQVDLLDKGFAAGYEPMQLRPLVLQARLNVVTARNQHRTAWRQLAATLGLPDMPPTEVEGRVDLPVPVFDYDDVLARLRNHTDVLTASVSLQKAKYQLQQAKLQVLPDVDIRVLTQKDYSTPPNQVANSVTVSLPIPVWDQNRGGIYAAKWNLAQASVGPEQARNALINTLADAFNRYLDARQTVDVAGRQIRDQVRVYRGLYERRQQNPDAVGFGDLVTAQQTLAGFVTSYVTALGLQWQATVDVANLLQTEDLYAAGQPQQAVEPLPDLRCLIPPPDHEHTATAAERVGLIPSPLRKPPRPATADPPAPAGPGPACEAPSAPPPAAPAVPPAPPPALPPTAEAAPALPMLPKRAALPEPQGQGAGPLVPLDPVPSAPAGRPRTALSEELRRGSLPPPTAATGQ